MNKKKGMLAVLSLLAVCSMTGCGEKAKSETAGENTGEIITLRILENDTAKEKGYLDELLTAFNAAYADKGIVAVDANMDEYSNLAENGPYGYGPDVLYQANDKLMTYAADKHLLAINPEDFECYDTTAVQGWEAFHISVDDKTYTCGIPVNVQEPMLFYRKDMLPADWESTWDDDQNGTPDFLENWNDLYAYSALLREDGKFGFMSSLNNLYLNANFLFSYDAYVFGQDEAGVYDSKDIGFAKGNAKYGMDGMIQFAGLMNEGCIDDTIISNRYAKVASGEYFCSVSTPDTYTLFVEKLQLQYESEGMDAESANAKAIENLMMIELPAKMPADGDFSKDSSTMAAGDWVDTVVMGGINGYGISSYTKHREACIEFVNFATSYEMINRRVELLGIAPTRADVASKHGGTTDMIFESLEEGNIKLMPSIKAVDQIWTPVQTLMGDMAKDAFRPEAEKKYASTGSIEAALQKASQDIYDAIYTLAE